MKHIRRAALAALTITAITVATLSAASAEPALHGSVSPLIAIAAGVGQPVTA